jgi:ATP-dependent helicase YprA (DUF1998 family)
MKNAESVDSFGVHGTAQALNRSLHQYIEAQYHIRDESLISERDALLRQPDVIAQLPYIEATPVYELAEPYRKLSLPHAVSEALTRIAEVDSKSGIHSRPYYHQAQALESFFAPQQYDLVVATGTGSGKTESFLMPIVGELTLESTERPKSRDMHGCRAILLYPMNALVNDQVARIRRLLGSESVSKVVSAGRGRPVRFGSYTGRTPYPNVRKPARDKAQIAPLFEDFYIPAEENKELKAQLVSMGRWPSKDMVAFYNAGVAQDKTYKSGKAYVAGNWKYRLLTQPNDKELMTRHEMHEQCPDILVTNYSMLEYMLLRPIERQIFEQTAQWLAADPRNQLILVLDEAHMYRGAGGAEVAMLIRRLIARLNITRDRVRCILTSASLGKGADAIRDVEAFATDLTGKPQVSGRTFRVITGRRETRPVGHIASLAETEALAALDMACIGRHVIEPDRALAELAQFSNILGWESPPHNANEVPSYLYSRLTGFGPAELLIEKVMGEATKLNALRAVLFPGVPEVKASRALDSLLALCTIAKEAQTGRVLMPTRVHLFYRGLPGLYACADAKCDQRHAQTNPAPLLGRFHTKSTVSCSCSNAGRVFEFKTHRDCGAAFLQGWVDKKGDFVWHEPDALSVETQQRELYPLEMLVEPPSPGAAGVREKWLHIPTGRLSDAKPADTSKHRLVYIPDKILAVEKALIFDRCPICAKRTIQAQRDESKIMDHVTKGEAPFSALVRAQLFNQLATRKPALRFPNAGRKVLIFSDGRQKAARLARDLPRDMELDVYRQTIAAAVQALVQAKKEPRPVDQLMYLAFLSVLAKHNLSMFDLDAPIVEKHVAAFSADYTSLSEALDDDFPPGTPPMRYKMALLKLLCSNYYSLSGTTVGFVEPSKKAYGRLSDSLGKSLSSDEIRALAVAWIDEMLGDYAFDSDIESKWRAKASGIWKGDWGSKASLPSGLKLRLMQDLSVSKEELGAFEQALRKAMAVETVGFYLEPNMVKLNVDLTHHWHQCTSCTAIKPFTFRGRCLNCGLASVRELNPLSDPYLQARKSFWRAPVLDALREDAEILNLYAEEHTAQLANRDRKVVHSTTEQHELRFQDVLINEKDRPIDVLSCTTTMEVGIDIGSLVAVALRNMPPQRENYQQRAGRAGRRGSAVSSVVTFSQNGPHDSHYFLNPAAIVSGSPRSPELKADNPKIARRHVHSFLIQTFFQEHSLAGAGAEAAILQKALGLTIPFFHGADGQPDLATFEAWLEENLHGTPHRIRDVICGWLPTDLNIQSPLTTWVEEVSRNLVASLHELKKIVPKSLLTDSNDNEDEDDESNSAANFDKEDLLEFLFFHALLPSYAFPTSLCSFLVEKWDRNQKGQLEVRLDQMPQQSTNQALSEYAPGRLVVINKKTYRSGGVFANTSPKEVNRAVPLFEKEHATTLVMCDVCSYVREPGVKGAAPSSCPVCRSDVHQRKAIRPEVFGPESARALSEDDREQDFTFATMAQFPQPVGGDKLMFESAGVNLGKTYATESRLVTLNKGANVHGEFRGFSVCSKCGAASVNNDVSPLKSGKHDRPYYTRVFGTPKQCDGHFEDVFLWFSFSTDLLVARIAVQPPLVTDVTSVSTVRTLDSAGYSISEALRLAASRHRQLDLDATEFGAGHRLLPADENGVVYLDIYLYDTLSGGAGYSELAAKYFDEIVVAVLGILEGCNCDTSCTECLDHFHNQHLKGRLDRFLGASLLRYALLGEIPTLGTVDRQERRLRPLLELLQLDGIKGKLVQEGALVGLVAHSASEAVRTVPHPALLPADAFMPIAGAADKVVLINELELRSNLPFVHSLVRDNLS